MKANLFKTLCVLASIFISVQLFATNYPLTTASGSFSVTTAYVDDVDDTWTINTGTAKPVEITYTANIEFDCDYVYIYAEDNSGQFKLVKEISGAASGTVSTILATGKAKIVFSTDGSVHYGDDDLTGFTISYQVDNATQTNSSIGYFAKDLIVDGNVGIGTMNPITKMDVRGAAYISQNLGLGNPNTDPATKLLSVNNYSTAGTTYGILSHAYNFGTGSVYGIYSNVGGQAGKKWSGYFVGGDFVVNGGKVGIGTGVTAPQAMLQINAEGNPANTEDNVNNGLSIKGTDQSLYMGVNSASHVSYIQSIDYATACAPLLLNARGGNVGIGTMAPSQALNVVGKVAIAPSGTISDEAYNGNLMITKPTASGQYINLVRQGSIPWSIGTVYNDNTFAIGVAVANDAAFTAPFLSINSSGNVGIGTANPQNALDVKGTIRATEVKVESVDKFADFVFEDDYKLPCLDEVKQYIDANGHLPNIPSAQEVKENGMSLVDMQVKLLQKVEELTLYSIKQQEQIKVLQAQLESLKQK